MHARQLGMNETGAVELAQDRHHAAGAMHVFHMHVRDRWRDLAEHRHLSRQPVDILHREGDLALMRSGEQMQHRIGRAAHGDVEAHRVLECLEARDIARQHAAVVLLVVAPRQIDDEMPGLDEQALAVGMGGEHRAVAGQGKTERFGEAVHRVGGEHAGTGAAGRTGRPLDHLNLGVADALVGRGNHGVDQVDRPDLAGDVDLAGFHRTARDEHRGDVEAHRRHQHARRDLVAVGDADHGVGAMRVDHVFDAVGDQLARGQAVEHAVMAHGDAVIDRDGVELFRNAAGLLDLACHQLAEILQVHVSRHELREGVDHRDDRLAEVFVRHAGRAPESSRAGHVAAVSGGTRAIGRHGGSSGRVAGFGGRS